MSWGATVMWLLNRSLCFSLQLIWKVWNKTMWLSWYTDNINCPVTTWKNTILPQNIIITIFEIDHSISLLQLVFIYSVMLPFFSWNEEVQSKKTCFFCQVRYVCLSNQIVKQWRPFPIFCLCMCVCVLVRAVRYNCLIHC